MFSKISRSKLLSKVATTLPLAWRGVAVGAANSNIHSLLSHSVNPQVVHLQRRFSSIDTSYDASSRIEDTLKLPVAFEDISRAHYRIQSGIRRTHCDYSQFLSDICECNIYLKKDFTQFTGSFKERGGRNSLMLLSPKERLAGVITASGTIYYNLIFDF